ncbi:hypothetical protein PLESTB_000576500 [Pleodorina starrii]|uniref:Uncharacterized protein n=1 Tax=Pleodorina starrii TaxID=330485 RepID=A0A9W6BH02_9CHLO|nr:hypothetical protein PLESTM_000308400 [Pleodorina starrii]GLC52046.1 hypothetical protein PLESTB_000576500 [Pleodorina starrii]GLC72187.1 hypothetical protein PLESTF_001216400 [Pleodorina starrii]
MPAVWGHAALTGQGYLHPMQQQQQYAPQQNQVFPQQPQPQQRLIEQYLQQQQQQQYFLQTIQQLQLQQQLQGLQQLQQQQQQQQQVLLQPGPIRTADEGHAGKRRRTGDAPLLVAGQEGGKPNGSAAAKAAAPKNSGAKRGTRQANRT